MSETNRFAEADWAADPSAASTDPFGGFGVDLEGGYRFGEVIATDVAGAHRLPAIAQEQPLAPPEDQSLLGRLVEELEPGAEPEGGLLGRFGFHAIEEGPEPEAGGEHDAFVGADGFGMDNFAAFDAPSSSFGAFDADPPAAHESSGMDVEG